MISRRDGILKFMFRIADFRRTQVPAPALNCCFVRVLLQNTAAASNPVLKGLMHEHPFPT